MSKILIDEAKLRLALELLDKQWQCEQVWSLEEAQDVANSIREALAEQKSGIKQVIELYDSPDQPSQQEPVAYMDICEKNQMSGLRYWSEPDNRHEVPLYTSPPAQRTWVGLTDEEVDECYYWKDRLWTTDELVRHVEAKLKEKNT